MLEDYILYQIKKLEEELKELISQRNSMYNFGGKEILVYTKEDYSNKFTRISSKLDILYLCITAHSNPLEIKKITTC